MEKVLFISNEIYLDQRRPDGGVRICTIEFIELLQQKYEVIFFPVKTNSSIVFKIKTRLGIGSYDAYQPHKYVNKLNKIIALNNIEFVFLNLTNTIRFSRVIKKATNGKSKIILCSHGNESGDFLHEVVRFRKNNSFIRNLFSSFALGRMLKIESYYRLNFIDMVLTVSEVESEIEKWLGAKKVFMVSRTIKKSFLTLHPIKNRVGIVADLSHKPNYSGIVAFCEALNKLNQTLDLRVVGGPSCIGEELQKRFSFISYLGYLDNGQLEKECSSWCFFLNLVFYYSRGVSTKLAKPLGWAIPVISTTAGIRGYRWKLGKMLIAETPADMACAVLKNEKNEKQLVEDAKQIALSMPTLKEIMNELAVQIGNIKKEPGD